MATVLSNENLTQGRSAIQKYRTTCADIFSKMQTDIETLTQADFVGEAATGYLDFFNQITPALTTNLTETSGSITSMLEELLTAAEQMLNPVDPQLGTANKTAGT